MRYVARRFFFALNASSLSFELVNAADRLGLGARCEVERCFVSEQKIEVGILGATGMVGQQFVSRLARHPWVKVTWLAASERSEDKSYAAAAPWRLAPPMPADMRELKVDGCVPGRGPKVVFPALDASAAD